MPPPKSRGFGQGAYNPTSSPIYSLSHVGHFSLGVGTQNTGDGTQNTGVGTQNTNSFYGGFSTPTTANVAATWGRSVQGSQFSSASLVSQTNGSSFNFNLHDGVVNMASVSVASNPFFQSIGHSGITGTGVNGVSGSTSHRVGYSWDPKRSQVDSGDSVYKSKGFLAPAPSTQAPADSPAGYSSI